MLVVVDGISCKNDKYFEQMVYGLDSYTPTLVLVFVMLEIIAEFEYVDGRLLQMISQNLL